VGITGAFACGLEVGRLEVGDLEVGRLEVDGLTVGDLAGDGWPLSGCDDGVVEITGRDGDRWGLVDRRVDSPGTTGWMGFDGIAGRSTVRPFDGAGLPVTG